LDEFPETMVDTAMVLHKMNAEEATKFIKRIGAHRVIFGTDYPGHDVGENIRMVKALGLTNDEKEKIFSQNVISFFNLS